MKIVLWVMALAVIEFNTLETRAAYLRFSDVLKIGSDSSMTEYLSTRDSLRAVGKQFIERRSWTQAIEIFEKLIQRDSTEMEDHYELAICHREHGFENRFVNQPRAYSSAEREFNWIILRDSSYHHVLYEYSLLLKYEGQWRNSIEAVKAEIRLNSPSEQVVLALFRTLSHYVATDNDDSIPQWLQSQKTDLAIYFLGEYYRDRHEDIRALQLYNALLETSSDIPSQAISISLAKIAFHHRYDLLGEEYYWRAVDGITDSLGSDLVFDDLKYIVNDSELQEYRRLSSHRSRITFFHDFWERSDGVDSSETSSRMGEYYDRLEYVENHYRLQGMEPPTHAGNFAFPNSYQLNNEFSDMGLVYLRWGAPDQTTTASYNYNLNDFGYQPQSAAWLYEPTDNFPSRTFFFEQKSFDGWDWHLVSFPNNPEVLGNIETWSAKFGDLLHGSQAMQTVTSAEIASESKTAVEAVFSTSRLVVPARPHSFEVPHLLAAFRGDSGKSLLNINYAIPIESVRGLSVSANSPLRAAIDVNFVDLSHQPIYHRTDTVLFQVQGNAIGSIIGQAKYFIPPGSYGILQRLSIVGTDWFGEWKVQKEIPNFDTKSLAVSDIQLFHPPTDADQYVDSTGMSIYGLKVLVSPFQKVRRDKVLIPYLQIYNLKRTLDGSMSYHVDYQLERVSEIPDSLDGMVGSSATRTITTLQQFNRIVKDTPVGEFSELEISNVSTGYYHLIITVSDDNSKQAISQSIQLLIR